VIVEFVVDDLANQMDRRRLKLLSMKTTDSKRQNENIEQSP